MQSKISPLAAVAAVVAFTAAPAFALDAHLVPIPTGGALDKAEDVTGEDLPDVAPGAAALPSGIPWPELKGFPRPFPGADDDADADDADADEASTTTWSTWCPDPTVSTWKSATVSVTTPTWATLTDCPLSSSSSSSASSNETVAPFVPHGRPHPHPYPGPEDHDGHSPEITSVAPIKPPSHTVPPVIPTHPVVVAGASKTQGFLLGVAAAALGLAVFGL